MENNLVTKQADMGVDIFPIYQLSCISSSVPMFEHLYDEYKVAILQKESNMTKEQVAGGLFLINQGYYKPYEVDLDGEKLNMCRPEPEFLDYLIANGYSFSLGKEYFNMPQKGVW